MRDALTQRDPERSANFDALDLNKIMIGTLDSLAQEVLNDHKRAGDPRPIPVDEHIVRSMLLTHGIFPSPISQSNRGARSEPVRRFLAEFNALDASSDPGRAKAVAEIRQRLHNDRVDGTLLRQGLTGDPHEDAVAAVLGVVDRFDEHLSTSQIFDFSSILVAFLERLQTNALADFCSELRFVLVDEYQDTNYLQESVYFYLARAAQ